MSDIDDDAMSDEEVAQVLADPVGTINKGATGSIVDGMTDEQKRAHGLDPDADPDDPVETIVRKAERLAEGGVSRETPAGEGDPDGDPEVEEEQEDPRVLRAQRDAAMKALEAVGRFAPAAKPAEQPPPPADAPMVKRWKTLAALPMGDAQKHYNALIEDGKEFEANVFHNEWTNAPSHLETYNAAQEARAQSVSVATSSRRAAVDGELRALTKTDPDWEVRYGDKMNELAKNSPGAFSSVEELYWAARGIVDRGSQPLPGKSRATKESLGRGPRSRTSSTSRGRQSSADANIPANERVMKDLAEFNVPTF